MAETTGLQVVWAIKQGQGMLCYRPKTKNLINQQASVL